MFIRYTTQPAAAHWGKNALLSFSDDQAQIHFAEGEALSTQLQQIQRAARQLAAQGIETASLQGDWSLAQSWAFYQGFDRVKGQAKVEFAPLSPDDQRELNARILASSQCKKWINTPAEILTPQALAEQAALAIQAVAPENSVNFRIISDEALKDAGFVGLWTVGKGSQNPPALLELDFNPSQEANTPVFCALVGKGITFDTGGYSLKPSEFMEAMRSDMGGAALLSSALMLAIQRGLNRRVKLILCCAENMVSDRAFRLGDLIHYPNGVSVEVLNTDAEGRLVLADGLILASQAKPELIIDAATLTGAAKIAVGTDYHSVLSQDDAWCMRLLQSAEAENEAFWRLPFADFHRAQVPSQFADIANVGIAGSAGASTATAFLSYFVENYAQNWLHIDCSATFRKAPTALWSAGATAIGICSLARLLTSA